MTGIVFDAVDDEGVVVRGMHYLEPQRVTTEALEWDRALPVLRTRLAWVRVPAESVPPGNQAGAVPDASIPFVTPSSA